MLGPIVAGIIEIAFFVAFWYCIVYAILH